MNLGAWERLCRCNGVVPIAREMTKHGEVFIAEGFRHPVPAGEAENHIESGSHFDVWWAIKRGNLDIAKHFACDAVEHTFQRARITLALREVDMWIKDCLKVGRYH